MGPRIYSTCLLYSTFGGPTGWVLYRAEFLDSGISIVHGGLMIG